MYMIQNVCDIIPCLSVQNEDEEACVDMVIGVSLFLEQ
jgi:hypothetical protein